MRSRDDGRSIASNQSCLTPFIDGVAVGVVVVGGGAAGGVEALLEATVLLGAVVDEGLRAAVGIDHVARLAVQIETADDGVAFLVGGGDDVVVGVVFQRGAVAVRVGDAGEVAGGVVFHAGGVAGGIGPYLTRSYTSDDFAVGVSLVPRLKSRIASGPT